MSSGNELDIDAILDEHRDMCRLLMSAVEAMRTHQRSLLLTDQELIVLKCREIEAWLDKHQGNVEEI